MSRNPDRGSRRGLYRDRENGWIFGVCAGVADWFEVRAGAVRLIAIVCLFLFFWPTVLIYAVAVLLFREKPLTWSGRCRENDFWKRCGRRDHWSHS